MAGAYAGARLAGFVTGPVQLAVFAAAMLVAAASMLRRRVRHRARPRHRRGRRLLPARPRRWRRRVTGIVGIGGGFLVVPALVLLAGLPMKQAIGTSLAGHSHELRRRLRGLPGRVDVPWASHGRIRRLRHVGMRRGRHSSRRCQPRHLGAPLRCFWSSSGTSILFQNRARIRWRTDLLHARSGPRRPTERQQCCSSVSTT